MISEGHYTQVVLANENKTGKDVAIKIFNNNKVIQFNKEPAIINEENILNTLKFRNPHSVNLLDIQKVSVLFWIFF